MKKNILSVLLLIFSNIVSSQEIMTELQNIIPPSPSVAGLMKFEEVSVNNYTGIPDISIPLYSVESLSKDINIDLSLKYHPSSIMAGEEAGYTGLGWNLFAGGMISRTVRGIPDELYIAGGPSGTHLGIYQNINPNPSNNNPSFSNNYYKVTEQIMDNWPNLTGTDKFVYSEFLWENNVNGSLDTQHDLYQFNFMGHSGRFYLKKNAQGNLEVKRLDNNHNLKIEFDYTYNPSTKAYTFLKFTIFDDKGYKYVFDVIETQNQATSSAPEYFGNHMEGPPLSISSYSYTSAFHLSRIYAPNEQELVRFHYNSNNELIRELSRINNNTYRYVTSENILQTMQLLRSKGYQESEFKKLYPKISYVTTNIISLTKKIKKIDVINKAKIYFTNEQGRLDTSFEGASDVYKLKEIDIRSWTDSLTKLKRFVLEYGYTENQGLITKKRLLLKKVKEFGANNNSSLDFELFYKTNDIRTGQSVGQDYWGYYNLISNSSIDIGKNKEPNPSYCTTDVLQKMKLPAKGCVLFDFESNTYSHIGSAEVNDYYENTENWEETTQFKIFESPDTTIQNLGTSSQTRYVTFEPYSSASGTPPNPGSFTLVKNSVPVVQIPINCVGTDYTNDGSCATNEIILEANQSYSIVFNWLNTGTGQGSVKINIRIKKPSNTIAKYFYGGGVRIGKIGYFDIDVHQKYYEAPLYQYGQIPSKEKQYDYSFFTDLSKSSGSLAYGKPVFLYHDYLGNHHLEWRHPQTGLLLETTILNLRYDVLTFSNNILAQRTQGGDVGYQNVTVWETDNGKSQYKYTSPIDEPETNEAYNMGHYPFLPSRNLDYRRGLLKEEKHYHQNSRVLTKTVYNYNIVEAEEMTGVVVYTTNPCEYFYQFNGIGHSGYYGYLTSCLSNPLQYYCGYMLCGPLNNFIFYHKIKEAYGWAKLTDKVTTNYFYEGSTQSSVIQTETFDYEDSNKKIKEHTVTNSMGETLKTNYYYDAIHFNINRIGVVKKIETRRNSTLLETREINFSGSWQGHTAYLPETISVAKGTNPLESRVRYIKYDEYSNPLEVKQEDGIHIVYLWGYNKAYPIAKIENATYSQVTSALGITNISETNLNSINNLRNNSSFSNSLITTYTYKPLVGVTSITDPRDYKTTYEYDSFGRLEFIKDASGNILEENKYNYRP